MSENSGTDARFPYEHRQNVVVRLCMFLLLEQERTAQTKVDSDLRRVLSPFGLSHVLPVASAAHSRVFPF